jgi:acetyl-CoA carboxylase biotin carboxyl carrier protein
MTLQEIRELIQLVTDTGIAELEVQRADNRVRIRRAFGSQDVVIAAPQQVAAAVAAAAPAPAPAAPPPATEKAASEAKSGPDPNLFLVRSPIVGTFYEASAPGAPPFVRVGEAIQPGKVLCIIESMKLMNEIEAEVSGVIESKLVQNGQPVEYGEALFAIRTA